MDVVDMRVLGHDEPFLDWGRRSFFFFNDTATTEIYTTYDTLSLHDALPISDAVPLMPTLLEDFRHNPTGSLVTIRCAPWFYGHKVCLLGDAAHAVVPFYGQGMNAAFEDCIVLDECLEQFPNNRERAFGEYFSRRKENADALADLAIGNFIEMRDKTASKTFRAKKKLDHFLEAALPGIYLPLYTMVTFTRIPYAQAARRARFQDRIVFSALILLAISILTLPILLFR